MSGDEGRNNISVKWKSLQKAMKSIRDSPFLERGRSVCLRERETDRERQHTHTHALYYLCATVGADREPYLSNSRLSIVKFGFNSASMAACSTQGIVDTFKLAL